MKIEIIKEIDDKIIKFSNKIIKIIIQKERC